MTINVPLLRKTLEWVYGEHLKAERGEISEWSQEDWMVPTRDVQPLWNLDREDVDAAVREGAACGTACCIAGKVAYDEGWRAVAFMGGTVGRYGVLESIFDVSARLLGLSDEQALDLFSAYNTIRDLYRIAGKITDGEIQPPPGLGPVR